MAVTFTMYDKAIEYAGDGTIDLDDGVNQFYIILLNSTHTFAQAETLLSEVTANQLATNYGYVNSAGGDTGKSMGTVTWVEAAGVVTWDSPDISWSVTGSNLVASDANVFADESAGVTDALMFDLDFGGDQTATPGGTFNINWNGSGIFSIP